MVFHTLQNPIAIMHTILAPPPPKPDFEVEEGFKESKFEATNFKTISLLNNEIEFETRKYGELCS